MLSVATTLGILLLGALPGVFLSVTLMFLWLLHAGSLPHDTLPGRPKREGLRGFHGRQDYPHVVTYPELLICRFEADPLFFNVDYFKHRLLKAMAEAETSVERVVIDASPINMMDMTAVQKMDELHAEPAARGIVFARARTKRSGARFFSGDWRRQRRVSQSEIDFPTIRAALKAFQSRPRPPSPSEVTPPPPPD